MVFLSILACGGCLGEADSADTSGCWEPLECSGECTTLDEFRTDAVKSGGLRYWQESRCGDGRTEVSYSHDGGGGGGGTLCFGPDGHMIGSHWSGSDFDTGDGPCDGLAYYGELCDCNADGEPAQAGSELEPGECYSALDCGDDCWTLEEQRAFCAELGQYPENQYATTDATCADGRVEFLCHYIGYYVTYCFSAEGKLLGAEDGITREDACEDYEGELCDCDGDGLPEGSE